MPRPKTRTKLGTIPDLRLCTISEAAKILNISIPMINRMISEGRIATVDLNRNRKDITGRPYQKRRRILLSEIYRFVDSIQEKKRKNN